MAALGWKFGYLTFKSKVHAALPDPRCAGKLTDEGNTHLSVELSMHRERHSVQGEDHCMRESTSTLKEGEHYSIQQEHHNTQGGGSTTAHHSLAYMTSLTYGVPCKSLEQQARDRLLHPRPHHWSASSLLEPEVLVSDRPELPVFGFTQKSMGGFRQPSGCFCSQRTLGSTSSIWDTFPLGIQYLYEM